MDLVRWTFMVFHFGPSCSLGRSVRTGPSSDFDSFVDIVLMYANVNTFHNTDPVWCYCKWCYCI